MAVTPALLALASPTDPAKEEKIWTWRLWGLGSAGADRWATLATLALLACSRFALLPSGPWDWDETLFARGILDFDLPAHYPHPPGFPLWMALGWLVHFVVSEPLRGLQFLSGTFSCLTLWPLAALGRRVAPAPVAAAAALFALTAPGVWLHAMRGFSSTPAAFFALWAAALALRPAERRPLTAFTALLTAAFLVRPILLPPLALLWLAGVWRVRPRSRLLPGVLVGIGATVLAVVGMVLAQGSWVEFLRPFYVHGRTHARNLLGNTGGFAELGIVKGLGGPVWAGLIVVLVAAGMAVWWRRVGRDAALAWLAVLTVGVGQLIWLQNRTFSRYAVPYQMAAGPLVAGVAALFPPALGTGALLVGTALLASKGWGPVLEQHTRLMPGWEALRFAATTAAREGLDLVIEPGLHPFWSYLDHCQRAAGEKRSFAAFLPPSSPDARELPPGRYLLVTDFPANYLPTPWERRWQWSEVSDALRPLTSGRFLNVAVVEGAALPVRDFWPAERGGGEAFAWGGANAELLLPPFPHPTSLAMDVQLAPGPAPLAVRLNGMDLAVLPGDAPRLTLPIHPASLSATRSNRLSFLRERGYPPGSGDFRPLAVRVFGFPADDAAWPAAHRRLAVTLAEAGGKEDPSFFATGLYPAEDFPRSRGAWTHPEADLTLPLANGVLTFTLWAPRPGPVLLHIDVDGQQVAGPLSVGTSPHNLSIVFTQRGEKLLPAQVKLRSEPYLPAAHGAADPRRLGVVLGQVRFAPLSSQGADGWLAVPDRTGAVLRWAPTEAATTFKPAEMPGAAFAPKVATLLRGDGAAAPLPRAGGTDRYLVEVEVSPQAGAALVELDGRPVAVLPPGTPRTILDLPAPVRAGGEPPWLGVRRARPEGGEVAVMVHSVEIRGPRLGWRGTVAEPLERARLGVRVEDTEGTTRPLPAIGFHPVERFPAGAGSWTLPRAELPLPAAGGTLRLKLAAPRPTAADLRLLLDGEPLAGPLPVPPEAVELLVTLPPTAGGGQRRLGLQAKPFVPARHVGGDDERELGVVLFGGELEAWPGSEMARWVLSPPVSGVTWVLREVPAGSWGAERFGERLGCWVKPRARLNLPVGPGILTLTAWAPRPLPAGLEIWADGVRLAGPVNLPATPTELLVAVPSSAAKTGEAVLELRAVPYSPRRHGSGSDPRELGVVLGELAFTPAE